MQIDKFISIPRTQSSTGLHPYLSLTELLLSLLTGIIVICINMIDQFIVVQSQFQVLYLFTVLMLGKAALPINYIFSNKLARSRLQEQARVDIAGLFIPAFIKSLLYFGLVMLVMYMGWLLVLFPLILSGIGVQIMWCWLLKKNQQLLPLQLNTSKDYDEMKKRERNKGKSVYFNFKQILIQILLIISLILHVQYFETVYNIETVVLICFSGSLCLVAFYYMHHQIFQLYHSSVDEVLAKEYPVQLFNFFIYFLIYYFSSSSDSQAVVASTNSKIQKSPGFLFILQYPIHTTAVLAFSILYQYISLQMIKKSSFKYLFLTQITGIFWYNLYAMKEGLTTSRYFSTFFSFISLLMLTRLLSVEKIYNRIIRLKKLWKKRNENRSEQMVEQMK